MKVPDSEGRSDPRCPRVMRGASRGATRSVDRGACRPAIEPRKIFSPGCRRCSVAEGNTRGRANRECPCDPAWSETLACRTLLAREPGDLRLAARGGSRGGPHREGEEPKPMMHEREKSDSPIVAMKSANKPGADAGSGRSRWSEGRGPRGTRKSHTRAGRRAGKACPRAGACAASSKAEEEGDGSPRCCTTSTSSCWRQRSSGLKRNAAAGVDGVTWQRLRAKDLEAKLVDLHARIHRGRLSGAAIATAVHPESGRTACGRWASRRWRTRSSSARWWRCSTRSTRTDFLGFSYGFRPGRGQHDALDALAVGITRTKVNWILDADISASSTRSSHEWLIRFVEHRIGDPRVIRLIRKWLKAGVMEDGSADGQARRGRRKAR